MATNTRPTVKVGGKIVERVDPSAMEENGDYGWCIVVVDRGFVWVGDVLRCGESFYISNAQNIRKWGTKKGLGELAMTGPTPETSCDPVPVVIVSQRAVIAVVPSERSKWPGY